MEIARFWQWIKWKKLMKEGKLKIKFLKEILKEIKLMKEGKLKIYEDSKSKNRENGSSISGYKK